MIHTSHLWLRKVNNTFVIAKYDKIETLDELQKVQLQENQVMCESSTNNTVPFLDCLIE